MERPHFIEAASERCAEIKRRIAAYIFGELERFDSALDVDFGDEEDERLAAPQKLKQLEDESNIIRSTE